MGSPGNPAAASSPYLDKAKDLPSGLEFGPPCVSHALAFGNMVVPLTRFLLEVLAGDTAFMPGTPDSPKPACVEALEQLCHDAKRSSRGNCFVCTGMQRHHQALAAAGCQTSDYDDWC